MRKPIISFGEKRRDRTKSYDKIPNTNGRLKQLDNKKSTKMFDYKAIVARIKTISWNNDSDPTCVLNRFTGYQPSQ